VQFVGAAIVSDLLVSGALALSWVRIPIPTSDSITTSRHIPPADCFEYSFTLTVLVLRLVALKTKDSVVAVIEVLCSVVVELALVCVIEEHVLHVGLRSSIATGAQVSVVDHLCRFCPDTQVGVGLESLAFCWVIFGGRSRDVCCAVPLAERITRINRVTFEVGSPLAINFYLHLQHLVSTVLLIT